VNRDFLIILYKVQCFAVDTLQVAMPVPRRLEHFINWNYSVETGKWCLLFKVVGVTKTPCKRTECKQTRNTWMECFLNRPRAAPGGGREEGQFGQGVSAHWLAPRWSMTDHCCYHQCTNINNSVMCLLLHVGEYTDNVCLHILALLSVANSVTG
jgi:hypothetical protein